MMLAGLLTGVLLLGLYLATPAWAGQLTLTWTDNAIDEQGFRVERCQVIAPATSCANYIQIASVASMAEVGWTKTWANSGAILTLGSTWCYRVRAFNASGASEYSNEACGTVAAQVPPAAATDLTVQ